MDEWIESIARHVPMFITRQNFSTIIPFRRTFVERINFFSRIDLLLLLSRFDFYHNI